MTPTTNPVPPAAPAPVSITVHAPYEDAIVAALTLATQVAKDAPQATKERVWDDFNKFHDFLGNLASKLDFLHLFNTSSAAK